MDEDFPRTNYLGKKKVAWRKSSKGLERLIPVSTWPEFMGDSIENNS